MCHRPRSLKPLPPNIPILVLSKDPVALNASLYRFWQARRPELDIGENISEFVRRRFIVYDSTNGNVRPHYAFPTPTEYWNQFYFSWLNWCEVEAQRVFLRIEDLKADPDGRLSAIAERFGLSRAGGGTVALPKDPVGPTPKPRDDANGGERLTDADIAYIHGLVDREVAHALGYPNYA